MPAYITLGNFTLDDVVKPDGQKMVQQVGGDCLYTAMGIRLWEQSVGIVSIVGANYPAGWLDKIQSGGIDVAGIKRSTIPDGLGGIMIYDEHGTRSFAPLQEPSPSATLEQIEQTEIENWYNFSPLGSDIPADYLNAHSAHVAPMPFDRQTDCLRVLRNQIKKISLDMPWWPSAQTRAMYPDIRLSDIVLLSEFEVAGYFGDVTLAEAAEILRERGARLIVFKQGKEGSVIFNAGTNTWWNVPVYPANVQDPTGAGDAYCGGFLVGMNETGDPLQAALYGTVSASFIIEDFGALYSLNLVRADVEQRLAWMRTQIRQ